MNSPYLLPRFCAKNKGLLWALSGVFVLAIIILPQNALLFFVGYGFALGGMLMNEAANGPVHPTAEQIAYLRKHLSDEAETAKQG